MLQPHRTDGRIHSPYVMAEFAMDFQNSHSVHPVQCFAKHIINVNMERTERLCSETFAIFIFVILLLDKQR